jgi:hypothetical protein
MVGFAHRLIFPLGHVPSLAYFLERRAREAGAKDGT